MERTRLVVGAMTGTSIDGIDLALVRIAGSGLGMRAEPVAFRSASLGPLAPRLRAVAEQRPVTAGELAALAAEFGELHAREARTLVDAAGAGPPDLASIHGQTVFHRPPIGWQLVNPHPVARALGCAVVSDLRGADLAAGGQGAPLTPLADWILFRGPDATAVVNLGGFANLTLLPADDGRPATDQVAAIRGADLCACNQLLDRAARTCLGRDFDEDGAAALAGRPHDAAGEDLRARLAPAAGRSLGTGDELSAWVEAHAGRLPPSDLLATAADAVGRAIGEAIAAAGAGRAVVAGGGVRNRRLLQAVAARAGCPTTESDAVGIPAGMREATGWAVLGALAADGVEVALPQVTGRPEGPVTAAGAWVRPRMSATRTLP